MTAKSPIDVDAENSSATSPRADLTSSSETLREAITRLTSGKPRFHEVKPSGKAFVIVGARPSKPTA